MRNNVSFHVSPSYLEGIESGLLADMIAKDPAYVDWKAYPYDQATFVLVKQAIEDFDNTKDGYLRKDGRDWRFHLSDNVTLTQMSDVDLAASTDGTPADFGNYSSVYSQVALNFNTESLKFEPHLISAMSDDYFGLTEPTSNNMQQYYSRCDPAQFSKYGYPNDLLTLFNPFMGKNFGEMPIEYLDYQHYYTDQPAYTRVNTWAQAAPGWSSYEGNEYSRDDNRYKLMAAGQTFMRRPLASWEPYSRRSSQLDRVYWLNGDFFSLGGTDSTFRSSLEPDQIEELSYLRQMDTGAISPRLGWGEEYYKRVLTLWDKSAIGFLWASDQFWSEGTLDTSYNGLSSVYLTNPATESNHWWDDGTYQSWPDRSVANFANPTYLNNEPNFTYTSSDQRLVPGAARTKLDHIAPKIDETFAGSREAARYAFDEVTKRLDLLYECCDVQLGTDVGRLGQHSRINQTENFWQEANGEIWEGKQNIAAAMGAPDFRNSAIPTNFGTTFASELDVPIATNRGFITKYNERGSETISAMTGNRTGGSSYRNSTPGSELGRQNRFGENMGTKSWIEEVIGDSFIVNAYGRRWKTSPKATTNFAWMEDHNWGHDSGSFRVNLTGDSVTVDMGTNITDVYINWIRPFILPGSLRQGGPLGLEDDGYQVTTFHKNSDYLIGTERVMHMNRQREYMSLTLVFDKPQPTSGYTLVAFPDSELEREIPSPQNEWEAMIRANGHDTDGYPVYSALLQFYRAWGVPETLQEWTKEGFNHYATSETTFRVTDAAEQKRWTYQDFMNLTSLAAGYDYYGLEQSQKPQKGNPVWAAGPMLKANCFIAYNKSNRIGNYQYSREESTLQPCYPDPSAYTGFFDPIMTTYRANTDATREDQRVSLATGSQMGFWNEDYINHVPLDSPFWLGEMPIDPDEEGYDWWGRPRGVQNVFAGSGGWYQGVPREPYLRTVSNSVYKDSREGFNPAQEPARLSGNHQWTRVLYQDTTSCTILVPTDWFRMNTTGGVTFATRRVNNYGLTRGVAHPNFERPVYQPKGTVQTGGLFGVDWETKFYNAYSSKMNPSTYKGVSDILTFSRSAFNSMERQAGISFGSETWGTMEQINRISDGLIAPAYSRENMNYHTSRFFPAKDKAMWYDPTVNHWLEYGEQEAFRLSDQDVTELASQGKYSTQGSGWPNPLTSTHNSSVIFGQQTFNNLYQGRYDEKGQPKYINVYGIEFVNGVKFRDKTVSNTYSRMSAPKGTDIQLVIAGDSETGGSRLTDPDWKVESLVRQTDTVNAGITSESINPDDWSIPEGTVIMFNKGIPMYSATPESNVSQPLPYLAVSLVTPAPVWQNAAGQVQPAFDVLTNFDSEYQFLQAGEDQGDVLDLPVNFEKIIVGNESIKYRLITDARQGDFSLEDSIVDLGDAGEGWGFDPNSFGGPGTPSWLGPVEEPWLDAQGIIDRDNQQDSAFGNPDDVS